MRIKMICNKVGAANEMGSASKSYLKGETYDMELPWELDLAQIFLSNGWAVEEKMLNEAPENKSLGNAPENKDLLRGAWATVRKRIKDLTGTAPKNKVHAEELLAERNEA